MNTWWVCPGSELHYDWIEDLAETVGKNGVASNYRFDLVPYTEECIRNFKGGNAIFTQPATYFTTHQIQHYFWSWRCYEYSQ